MGAYNNIKSVTLRMMELMNVLFVFVSFCFVCTIGCPREYDVTFNDTSTFSCYFFSHDKETWTGALISCQALEGYLVEINTEAEYTFLREASRQKEGISRWTALSDKRSIYVWEWATSHSVYNQTSFDMWAIGEPDQHVGQKDESCVLLDKFEGDGKVHDFQLADVMCNRPEKYICEYNPPQIPRLAVGK